MDRGRNLLIGIVVGVIVVGALIYVKGLTKEVLSPFRSSSSSYKSSQAATAPDFASGDWIKFRTAKTKRSARTRGVNRVLDFRLLQLS